MKDLLIQLLQFSYFEYACSIDLNRNNSLIHEIGDIHFKNHENDFHFILQNLDVNIETQYIPSFNSLIKDKKEQNKINNKYFASIYIYVHKTDSKKILIFLSSSKKVNGSQKEQALLKATCENYFLKQELHNSTSNPISESKELFQIMFNAVPEAISFHELPSHKTIMINKAFEEYTGLNPKDVINKTGKELDLWVDNEDRIRYRKELEKKGFVNNLSTRFKLKNGKSGTGLISGKIVQFKNKPHLLLIIRDISKIQTIQDELKNSEEKFRNLFNSLPDPVSINKLDQSMAFTDVNKAFEEHLNMSASELIGKSGFELNLWNSKFQREEYIKHIKKHGEISNFQASLRLADGSREEGLISAKSIEIKKEPHLLVILKSIDSIIKLKQNLEISEKKFRSIFDSSPDAININKLDTGEFVDINRSFLQTTGYLRKELVDKSINKFDFWQSKEDEIYYRKKLKEHGRINNFETKIKLKDGRPIHVLISAIIIKIENIPHIVNLSRNIEDIKSIQRGLKESESRFRTIIEKSHSTILIIDEDQNFVYVNPKAQELFDYSWDELIGMNFEKVLHPDSIEIVKERYAKRQLGEKVPDQYEFKILQKNGGVRDVEISSSIYFDKNGKTRTIAQLLDITERNRAFSNLKKEQLKAQNYLDIAAFMIISIDIEGKILMVNKKACEILGYSEQELIGNNWFKLCLPKAIRKQTKERVQLLFKNSKESSHSENNIETKDGKERVINWHSTILHDEKDNPSELISAGEDITEKVNSLKIISQTKTVAIIWKYNPNSTIYPIKYVSENIKKLIGFSSEELITNKIKYLELIHPDDLDRVLEEVDHYANSDAPNFYTHEYYRLKTKWGKWIWVEDQTEFITNEKGEITHLSGILNDVTDKKQNLELIKSNEERYKTVFFSNLDGMVIFNEKGDIVEVNDVLVEMYGYSRKELLHRKDQFEINIGSDLDLPYVKKQLKNRDSISSESIDTRKDGSKFHVSSKLRWINYNNENHILAIFRDISDKKASEMELLSAMKKAEESDRLKSSFLANMSHEIRTPMNAIIGFSSLLEEPEIEEEEKLSFISRIKNNSQQLLTLINDIIDISKIEANQVNLVYSRLQVDLFLHSIYELFEIQCKENKVNLSFECHDQEKMNNFKTDSNRLTQIISNLMSNALKFTPNGGSIILGSYPSPTTSEIIFYVKDTGIGIPKNAQQHIFQRFRQAHEMTHKDYGGTGLGLSIVKGLIDSMNGRIWVESEENKGSHFFIALPHTLD